MILLLSPAKTIETGKTPDNLMTTEPQFTAQAQKLMKVLQKLKGQQLQQLMDISEALADLNVQRNKVWGTTKAETGMAVYSFNGEVYRGMKVNTWSKNDLEYAKEHLIILSGLYGMLKPTDAIHPYRLEMGTKLKVDKNHDGLYNFWSETLTKTVLQRVNESRNCLVNLASDEYFKVLKLDKKKVDIITPSFLDMKNGKYKMLTVYAKYMRGVMASWMIQNQVRDRKSLFTFKENHYSLNPELSTDMKPVFTRG